MKQKLFLLFISTCLISAAFAQEKAIPTVNNRAYKKQKAATGESAATKTPIFGGTISGIIYDTSNMLQGKPIVNIWPKNTDGTGFIKLELYEVVAPQYAGTKDELAKPSEVKFIYLNETFITVTRRDAISWTYEISNAPFNKKLVIALSRVLFESLINKLGIKGGVFTGPFKADIKQLEFVAANDIIILSADNSMGLKTAQKDIEILKNNSTTTAK